MTATVAAPFLLGTMGALFGAIVGSLLTRVIHRLPRMIDAAEGSLSISRLLAGMAAPSSHCPKCRHAIGWRDKVPIATYVLRRGLCRFCNAPYGTRYLVVEAATAGLFAGAFAAYGLTGKTVLLAMLFAGLVALVFIDLEEQILPDILLFPLLGLGLVFQASYGAGIADAVLGGAVGYGTLGFIRYLYRACRNVEGMGLGDVKFAGVIGAWIGLYSISTALFIAFAAGTALMLPAAMSGRLGSQTPVPFGPFLALGSLLAMVLPNLPSLAAGLLR
jgi:leader peptidase (prepilin peptidase) / N-methyltransferase